MYSPGQVYVLAALFRLFESSILVERMWDTFQRALLALLVFVITNKISQRNAGFLAWFIAIGWLGSFRFYSYPVVPALLWCLASIVASYTYMSQRSPHSRMWLFSSGIFIGLATLYKHEVGFFAAITQLLVLIAFLLEKRKVRSGLDPKRSPDPGRNPLALVYFAGGIAVILLPIAIFFIFSIPADELVFDLVIFPATVYPSFRQLPYPAPFINPLRVINQELSPLAYLALGAERLAFYLPPLTFVATILLLPSIFHKERSTNRARFWTLVMITLLGLFLFNQARIRSDLVHLTQAFIPAMILLIVITLHYFQSSVVKRKVVQTLVFAILGIILVKPVTGRILILGESYLPADLTSHGIPRAQPIELDPDQVDTIGYIQTHVARDEKIFIGNFSHDKILINDIILYFLAERDSGTKYHELHPGLATTLPIQQGIVADLERNRVGTIVLLSRFQRNDEPNESSISSGVTFLDEFIRLNYHLVAEFGDYSIWER